MGGTDEDSDIHVSAAKLRRSGELGAEGAHGQDKDEERVEGA